MTKTLLRSGNLDDYQSVGGGGQAVFTSALQIRETLRLQKHDALVACLAVPQVNDDGDRVDWYAPRAGKVVAWKAADEAVQARALAQLTLLFEAASRLSASCQQSTKTARRLFGALLEKALQFPGPNHVFLVDNSPVIAFWGFVNLNEQAREAPFACLQPPARMPDPAPALPPAGLAAAYSEPWTPQRKKRRRFPRLRRPNQSLRRQRRRRPRTPPLPRDPASDPDAWRFSACRSSPALRRCCWFRICSPPTAPKARRSYRPCPLYRRSRC